jgi:hypothetical protein
MRCGFDEFEEAPAIEPLAVASAAAASIRPTASVATPRHAATFKEWYLTGA